MTQRQHDADSTHEITIEKGIPMPRTRYKRRYPFEEMEVGDSFSLVAATKRKVAGLRSSIFGSIRASRAAHRGVEGMQFSSRARARAGGGYILRVWRIK